MRHLKAGRRLGRSAPHRRSLFRNLARALFEHGRIVTTVEKAKELRPFAEKLITLAKKGTLHARRLALSRLPDPGIVDLLFNEIAPRYVDRPGGYTRIIKRHERRLGDAGRTAFIELLQAGEVKPARQPRPAPAPAPRVTPESPAETTPPTEAPQGEAQQSQAPAPETTSTETPQAAEQTPEGERKEDQPPVS